MSTCCQDQQTHLNNLLAEMKEARNELHEAELTLASIREAIRLLADFINEGIDLAIEAAKQALEAAKLALKATLGVLVTLIQAYHKMQEELGQLPPGSEPYLYLKALLALQKERILIQMHVVWNAEKVVAIRTLIVSTLQFLAAAAVGIVLALDILLGAEMWWEGKVETIKEKVKEIERRVEAQRQLLENCLKAFGTCAKCGICVPKETLIPCKGCGGKFHTGCFSSWIEQWELTSK